MGGYPEWTVSKGILLKWMICGCPYLWKPPYIYIYTHTYTYIYAY